MEFLVSIPIWGWVLIVLMMICIGYIKIRILKKLMNKKNSQPHE